MITHRISSGPRLRFLTLATGRWLATLLVSTLPAFGQGGWLTLANPHWNITLTDAGYSDYLLDNTPGFEGREYLSGEWGAAVGYQPAGGPVVAPQWLERQFVFPDWTNNSPFHVVTALAQTGLNADNLPIAQAVLANSHLEITLRHEMVDTVTGTPMGMTPASATNVGAFILSDRYVLKQTASIKNISGAAVNNVEFFQLLHGLNSQRGVYDHRLHEGVFSEFCHDVTQAGVDAWAVGAGSSSAGLEDLIAFHASTAPTAFELGYYGVEGNGVDDHAFGKPSDGVHLSIENNWLTPPYAARQGTDSFAPAQSWVAGAQRWSLGSLASGQSVSLDVLLTLRTGTRVATGPGSSGGCNGGSSVPGGVDYEFDDVSADGSCFGDYSQADETEIAVHVSQGEFDPFTFLTPGGPAQIWELEFSGTYSGAIHLTFGYDPTVLPPGFDQSTLCLYEFKQNVWQKLACAVNSSAHTLAVTVDTLGVFALGVDGGTAVTYDLAAGVSPANSGTVTGAGSYADGASATLVATADPGYVFVNWTEAGKEFNVSPGITFIVHSNRTLVANFLPVGSGRTITTSGLPANGGSTTGDGEYAIGANATVMALPNPGYKFSKWLVDGAVVSTASSYTFAVSTNRALVAKFKPVYSVVVIPEPTAGGELEADPAYEQGELAKLKAKPNPGYSFVHWTQNGVVVSDDPLYQFNVTGNRILVGHFAPGHRIDVSAEPVNGGIVSGGGVYGAGTSVNVQANAHPGYVFRKWTELGTQVSAAASYSFTASASRVLVATFAAQPSVTAIQSSPAAMLISWPAAANGWVLEECGDLNLGNWAESNRLVNIVGDQKQVIITPLTGIGFFRLALP